MNSKHTVIGIMAVIAILVSSSILVADSSSAEDEVSFDKYYYQQLTPDQKVIYDALVALDADTVGVGGSEGAHYIELQITGMHYVYANATGDLFKDQIQKDAVRAWEATKLDASGDIDWAFWTWTLDGIMPTVTVSSVDIGSSGEVKFVQNCVLHISVPDQFADTDLFKNAVSAVNAAVDAISVNGDSVSDKVRSINKILTSNPYKVTDTVEGHVYARTIYAIAEANLSDGSYYMTAEAYSAVFKALCDKNGVPCIQVYGTDGNNDVTAWNIISIDKNTYAVDAAFNAESSNKETWLASGLYTTSDNNAFGKVHRAFSFGTISGLSYDFDAEPLSTDGYGWPVTKDLVEIITEYAPWIFAGAICAIMAVALVVIARKGD